MSRITRKPDFGVSDQIRHKPGCTATEDGLTIEISYWDCTIYVAKTKSLICIFVFIYAKKEGFLMTRLICDQ